MEKFISGCLIRKKNTVYKTKRSSIKNNNSSTKENVNNSQFNNYKFENFLDFRDKYSSPRKSKKENCIIF